ncbi:MAG TPA: POTRA domain-containing protein [Kofleriaceae bacterium]|nr:POTRA domain-containing protein [Kofleriaceae bacterium]
MIRRVFVFLVLLAAVAHAQPETGAVSLPPEPTLPAPAGSDAEAAQPQTADRAACLRLDTTPGALLESTQGGGAGGLDTPIPWSEFAIAGDLVDDSATVHALLEPTMAQLQTTLSAARWKDIAAVTTKLGYQLVGHLVQGTKIVLHLAPLPMVREVGIDVPQHWYEKLLDEEIRRRLRARRGVYLPWEPLRRQCALDDERARIEDYLHDEGYADARVQIVATVARTSARLRVHVDLGPEYVQGHITIINPNPDVPLALSGTEIEAPFKHKKTCIVESLCFGTTRFTRTQHTEDVGKLRDLFHAHGYPSVRVVSSYDPRLSFDRRTHTVPITLTIDQRRSIDVRFDGVDTDALPDDELKKQLTFDAAGSSDDVEAATSAKALVVYLQGRGYFDARVTVERTRYPDYDLILFHIDPGPTRDVREVRFEGNKALDNGTLANLVATKPADFRNSLFGNSVAETSAQLASDVARIQDAYRRAGYRQAKVTASAATSPDGLDSSALGAALVLADVGHDLYVRFRIDEGPPTLLARIELELDVPKDQKLALCGLLLGELSDELGTPSIAIPQPSADGLCVANAGHGAFAFKEDDVANTQDRLRDFLFRHARPRAIVDYEARDAGNGRVIAHYKVRGATPVKLGHFIVRGNFHTQLSIIKRELHLEPGDPLTSDALAEGARRLRNTGLFDAVNIDLPDLCTAQSAPGSCDGGSVVDAVVRVEERYDFTSQLDINAGYSSYNGLFGGVTWAQRNLFGYGLGFVATTTYGTKITDLEATFTIPKYLVPMWSPFDFRTDITGLYKQQITPEFGLLTTEGFTVAFQHQSVRQRSATQNARSITYGFEYDYRLRTRQVDALRPIGVDSDESQVAVGTRTGSVGFTVDYEARVDRRGNLAPLASEDGYRLEGSVMYASPDLLGQDEFFKVSASGSKFLPIGQNLIVRFDLRYDEGFPLGGASLLPEVERFFAGGDSTVRGYNDDSMATEIVQVKVPPLGNISQIRVIPAGGNIRLLSSIDAQVRIWKVLAGAIFTDAGMISNEWSTVTESAVRPSVGTGLRVLTPFGIAALEYAVPLRPNLGDDPRGRIHFYFAARAQF